MSHCFPARIRDAITGSGVCPDSITEIRLRTAGCSALHYIYGGEIKTACLPTLVLTEDDLRAVLARLCAGSVHAYDEGLLRGHFSPMPYPGVRVGAAGRLLCTGDRPERLQALSSLCIRLPHAVVPGAAVRGKLCALVRGAVITDAAVDTADRAPLQSVLFYAPPGVGKTTLLRCLIRAISSVHETDNPVCAAVLDRSEELCGDGFADCTVDRFSGYPRGLGMEIATRAFAPQVLICDEIGSEAEAEEILRAQACGVPLIATAHADSLQTLLRRPCFARLHESRVFSRYVRLYRGGADGDFAFACEEGL